MNLTISKAWKHGLTKFRLSRKRNIYFLESKMIPFCLWSIFCAQERCSLLCNFALKLSSQNTLYFKTTTPLFKPKSSSQTFFFRVNPLLTSSQTSMTHLLPAQLLSYKSQANLRLKPSSWCLLIRKTLPRALLDQRPSLLTFSPKNHWP